MSHPPSSYSGCPGTDTGAKRGAVERRPGGACGTAPPGRLRVVHAEYRDARGERCSPARPEPTAFAPTRRYPCLGGTAAAARFCPIAEVPFRGANCSDAAGSEVGYDEILRRLGGANATTPRRWDANQGAPYFNTLEPARGARAAERRAESRAGAGPGGGAEGQVVQYWFDDPQSLTAKYTFARAAGLRGVGPYTFADVVSKADPMYLAFDAFLLPLQKEDVAV